MRAEGRGQKAEGIILTSPFGTQASPFRANKVWERFKPLPNKKTFCHLPSSFCLRLTYWSPRNSKLYDGTTSKVLQRQNHSCSACGLKLISDERVHLHHKDGNHDNWKRQNLVAVHESCHDYRHMGQRESQEHREPSAAKTARSDRTGRCGR